MCLVNLALLTGNLGKPGTGINPLRGQNNAQGAAHMGCDPGILTGSVSLKDAEAALRRISYRPTEEKVDKEFPYLLMTGRTLHQFNAGTMTMRTRNKRLRPTDFLEISPDDAEQLQFHKGDQVRVQSRYGSASLPIRITRRVKPGELFTSFHDAGVFLNRVTSPHRDRYGKSPEYKVTAVRIEKLGSRA
jgi:formate dehydrogenase major subunit